MAFIQDEELEKWKMSEDGVCLVLAQPHSGCMITSCKAAVTSLECSELKLDPTCFNTKQVLDTSMHKPFPLCTRNSMTVCWKKS